MVSSDLFRLTVYQSVQFYSELYQFQSGSYCSILAQGGFVYLEDSNSSTFRFGISLISSLPLINHIFLISRSLARNIISLSESQIVTTVHFSLILVFTRQQFRCLSLIQILNQSLVTPDISNGLFQPKILLITWHEFVTLIPLSRHQMQ